MNRDGRRPGRRDESAAVAVPSLSDVGSTLMPLRQREHRGMALREAAVISIDLGGSRAGC
jgi:hypothetical protein